MPLRIAHVTNEAFGFDTANGVQHVVYCLSHAQAELGHAVAVLSRDDNAINILGEDGRQYAPPAIRVAAAASHSLREKLLSRYFEPTLAERLVAWQPDIVHFHSVHIARNVALAAFLREARIPYCVTVHGALFDAAMRRGRWKKRIFNVGFERRYLNDARFVHAVSPHETEVIRAYGVHRPVVVVPNGPPPGASLEPTRPDALFSDRPWLRDRRIFMFVGRLDSFQKGLDLLIEAFAQSRLPSAVLVFVGPDLFGSQRKLAMLGERLGISRQLVFTGAAYGEERANLFAAADVFVHPSRWEGLSLSVLAAASAGKPCLLTRNADPFGELERAGAALIVEPSVSSIAAGLTWAAASDDEALREMGRCARRVAEGRFSWCSIAARLVDAYRNY